MALDNRKDGIAGSIAWRRQAAERVPCRQALFRSLGDGRVGDKGVNVYPGRVSADEAFLYNLHRAGTLNKPATIQRKDSKPGDSKESKRYLESGRQVGVTVERPVFAALFL